MYQHPLSTGVVEFQEKSEVEDLHSEDDHM